MKPNELKLLYVCTDFPYPPLHGGLVDMWNRILALHDLQVTVDLVATVATPPPESDVEELEKYVRHLYICKRDPGRAGIVSIKPGHVAIRKSLRRIELRERYDVLLMQTEFTSEIFSNRTLKYRNAIIRVDNDEFAFHIQTAKSERSLLRKIYFLQEALRIKWHSTQTLRSADMLWFVSHDELMRYNLRAVSDRDQQTFFVPSAVNLKSLSKPSLKGCQVLFVGNLWSPLNREAVEWYIANVHTFLLDIPGYHFTVAGSTRGKGCDWIDDLLRSQKRIDVHLDPKDLTKFYDCSAAFVNPMQKGAGVKLKTIEAVLRGLPVVSTSVGTEGSGLIDRTHYKRADTPIEFAAGIREFLTDKEIAHTFVSRSQAFISEHYDQQKILKGLLLALYQC